MCRERSLQTDGHLSGSCCLLIVSAAATCDRAFDTLQPLGDVGYLRRKFSTRYALKDRPQVADSGIAGSHWRYGTGCSGAVTGTLDRRRAATVRQPKPVSFPLMIRSTRASSRPNSLGLFIEQEYEKWRN